MIVVTGGAGFIGSALVWKLNTRGYGEITVVDEEKVPSGLKKENLKSLNFERYISKNDFLGGLTSGKIKPDVIFHLGACSKTTETDTDYIMETNYDYTKELASYAVRNNVRFIYASSAATYGDGSPGFSDSHENLKNLKPLNIYGKSKHLFDLYAMRKGLLDEMVGIKYFNVFGPNEYHKADMRSFVVKAYEQIQKTGKVKLFKSNKKEYGDGEQKRDFLYVKDAVDITLHFFDNPGLCGIFNAGTGIPRTWNDLAVSVFKACDKPAKIEYIEMPKNIAGQYQYYTCASIDKLRKSRYEKPMSTLEEAVDDYVNNYLVHERRLSPGVL